MSSVNCSAISVSEKSASTRIGERTSIGSKSSRARDGGGGILCFVFFYNPFIPHEHSTIKLHKPVG